MKIKTTKEALSGAVGVAMRAIPQKASIPMMETFRFTAAEEGVRLTATDGDTVISAIFAAEAEGESCIGAKMFSEIVKLLPGGEVVITTEGKSAQIDWASGHSVLPCFDPAEYPDVDPAGDPQGTFAIGGDTLCNAITHALPHVAVEILRPVLTGVHFNPVDGGFEVVASDSHSICIDPVSGESPARCFTIGTKGASAAAAAAIGKESVSVNIYEGRVVFHCGDTTVSAREIVGKFPAYQRIIPAEGENILKADIKSFTQSVRRVAICSNRASNHIKLSLDPMGCEVFAQDLGFGTTAREALDAEYSGNTFPVGFKYDLLLRAIGGLDGETFKMNLTAGNKAVLITSPDDLCKVVIMPVAVQ